MTATASLKLLGGFALAVEGEPISPLSRKSAVLLARLALAPNHRMDRESLANFLWPEADIEHARVSLRQTLTRLRRALGAARDALQADNHGAWLASSSWHLDVDRLRATGDIADFDPDLSGALLDGYEFREARIAEWLESERRQLNEIALRRLRDALDAALTQKAYSDAIGFGLRMVALDPYDEAAHRRLMQAYAGDGRGLRALRQYELLKRLLETELGVQPDTETRSFYAQLRAAQSAAPHHGRIDTAALENQDVAPETDTLRLVTVLHATVLSDVAHPGADLDRIAKSGQDLGGRIVAETSEGVTFVFDVGDAPDAGAGAALGVGIALLKTDDGTIALGVAAGLARRTGSSDLRGAVFGRAQRLALTAPPGNVHLDKAVRQLANVGHATEKNAAAGQNAWCLARTDAVLPSPESPFFGRSAELEFLDRQLDLASGGQGRVVHYIGEAGVGKSRLCEEIMLRATHHGFDVAHVVCRDNRTDSAPLKCRLALAMTEPDGVAEQAMSHLEPEDHDVLADLLQSTLPEQPRHRVNSLPLYASDRDLERTTNALAAILGARCAARPLLLVVEDCHLAGENGIAVLCAFAEEAHLQPVVLLTTELRAGERLRTALGAAAMDTPVTISDLRPLSPTESEELSRALLPADPARAQGVAQRSHGNPLFLVNMISAAPDQTGDMPSSILAMVQAQLDPVAPETQQTSLRAALLGQQVRKAELAEIFPETRGAMDLPHGLGQWFGECFHFAHQLIQEATYQLIPPEAAARMHLAAARYFRGREPVRFAEHALRCGMPDLAAEACKDAANVLLPQYRNDLASVYIEAGLAAGGLPDDQAELYFCRASMNRELGNYEAALLDYSASETIADSHRLRVQSMLRRCGILKLKARRTEARSVLNGAVSIATEHDVGSDTLSELAQEHGDLAFVEGDAEACMKHNAEALRLAEAGGHVLQQARALGGMGDAYYSDMQLRSAREAFQACVALCHEHRLIVVDTAHRPMVAQTEFYVTPGAGAIELAEDALRFARRAGSRRNEALALVVLSEILAFAAEWDRLEIRLSEADALIEAMGENRFEADFHYVQALQAYGTQRRGDAVALARKGLEAWPGSYLGPSFAGLLAAATDNPMERRESLDQGRSILSKGAVSHGRLAFLHFAADAALNAGDLEEPSALAGEMEAVAAQEPIGFAALSAQRSRVWSSGDPAAQAELGKELNAARLGLFAIPVPAA